MYPLWQIFPLGILRKRKLVLKLSTAMVFKRSEIMNCGITFLLPGPNAVEVAAIKLHPFSVVNLLHCVLAWIATGAQHHYYVISWRKHICHNLTFNLTVHGVALHLGVTSNEKLLFEDHPILPRQFWVTIGYDSVPVLIPTPITPDDYLFNWWVLRNDPFKVLILKVSKTFTTQAALGFCPNITISFFSGKVIHGKVMNL